MMRLVLISVTMAVLGQPDIDNCQVKTKCGSKSKVRLALDKLLRLLDQASEYKMANFSNIELSIKGLSVDDLNEEEVEELGYAQARLYDLKSGDLGRENNALELDLKSGEVGQKKQALELAIEAYSRLLTSQKYGEFAKARLKELRVMKSYMLLDSARKFMDLACGEVAVIKMSQQVLDHPDATKEMRRDAQKFIQWAERRLSIELD